MIDTLQRLAPGLDAIPIVLGLDEARLVRRLVLSLRRRTSPPSRAFVNSSGTERVYIVEPAAHIREQAVQDLVAATYLTVQALQEDSPVQYLSAVLLNMDN